MSFLDKVVLPNQKQPIIDKTSLDKGGGFLSKVIFADEQAQKADLARQETIKAENKAKQLGGFGGIVKETIKGLPAAALSVGKNIFSASTQPTIQAIGGLLETGKEIAGKGLHPKEYAKPSVAEQTALGLKYGAKVLGVGFLPISTAFSVAESVPALKPAVQILNKPFEIAGKLGAFAADRFVDVLPISEEDKNVLRPAFEEVGSIGGQVVLGGKVVHLVGRGIKLNAARVQKAIAETKRIKIEEKSPGIQEVGVKVAPKIAPEAQKGVPKAIPATKGIIPKELEPLAQEARKFKSAEDFVKIAESRGINIPLNKIGGLEPQPAPFPKTKRPITEPVEVVLTQQGDYILEAGNHRYHQAVFNGDTTIPAKIRFEQGTKSQLTDFYNQAVEKRQTIVKVPADLLPVKSGGRPELESRLEARVKESLKNVKDKEKIEITTYGEMSKEGQIKKAVNYVSKNTAEAMAVLEGKRTPPKGLLYNSIFLAMEQMGKENSELALKLSSLRSTRFGQEISILTERDPFSPVKYISELKNLKIQAIGGKEKLASATKRMTDSLKTEIKKNNLTPKDWSEFVSSITCS